MPRRQPRKTPPKPRRFQPPPRKISPPPVPKQVLRKQIRRGF